MTPKTKRYRHPKHDATVSTPELRQLPKSEKLDVMSVWYYDNYEDPVHNSSWIDGEYTYLHGGPYDARDELENEFSGVISNILMDELVDELNDDCDTWGGRPEYEPNYDDYPWSSTEPEESFAFTIEATRALMKVKVSPDNQQHFLRLQYASVITALETLLSDFFISIISKNAYFFRKFVETNKEFADQKFSLNQLYAEHSSINKRVNGYLWDVIWQKLKNFTLPLWESNFLKSRSFMRLFLSGTISFTEAVNRRPRKSTKLVRYKCKI